MPLSTTAPNPEEPFHHCMDPCSLPGNLARKENWAKCDMLVTVSLERQDREALADNQTELDALLPAILDRAFMGAL